MTLFGYDLVMAGLVPAIHDFQAVESKTWMPGSSPGMTTVNVVAVFGDGMIEWR